MRADKYTINDMRRFLNTINTLSIIDEEDIPEWKFLYRIFARIAGDELMREISKRHGWSNR